MGRVRKGVHVHDVQAYLVYIYINTCYTIGRDQCIHGIILFSVYVVCEYTVTVPTERCVSFFIG